MSTSQAETLSSNTFTFVPDPNLSLDDNLRIMSETMKAILKNNPEFNVKLEVMVGHFSTEELGKIINNLVDKSTQLDDMKPHSLDNNGNVLYKKENNG